MAKLQMFPKPTCISCRKARGLLLKRGAEIEERNMIQEPLTMDELDPLVGERNHLDFLNSKNELYRKLRRKERPPSRAQALKLLSKEPNLIRRPIVRRGAKIVLGFDEEWLNDLLR
jgi:Spx/MgsR family transcriptional regulator